MTDNNTKNNIVEELKKILEMLGEHKVYTYLSILVTTVIAGQIFAPSYSKTVLDSLIGLMGDVAIKTAEQTRKIESGLKNIHTRIANYVNRNKDTWVVTIVTYIVVALIFVIGGIVRQNGPFLLFGITLLVTPLLILGTVQNSIGRALSKKDNTHGWVKYGRNKIIISFMILLITLGYVVLSDTTLFRPLAILFLIFVLFAAAFMKKSADPVDALKRVSLAFLATAFILFMLTKYESTNRYITSVASKLNNTTLLKAVENEDQGEITKNIIVETEASPYRRALVDVPLYFSAQNGVDIENTFDLGWKIKAGEIVSVIKNRPNITDKFGKIWIYVRYQNPNNRFFTGYVQNRWFKTVENSELSN